jgi:predicted dehydrogenase
MINVAVVGLGFMGITHIKAYRNIANARVAALCDAVRLPVDGVLAAPGGNIGSDESLTFDMSQVKATGDLNELLADPMIDLIDICVPTLVHPKLAIAALEAGKHVICEKPLARTASAAREIEAAAKSAKGYFMPAMCIRFWPEYAWLKKLMDDQTHGKVLSARFRRVSEPPAWGREHFFDGAKSGGAILDLHIHDADFVQYCFGRPKAVFAQGFSRYSGEIDHVVAQYQVASGAAVSAEGGWVMGAGHGFEMSFTVIFENATVDFNSTRSSEPLRLFENDGKSHVISVEAGDGYLGELRYMIDCIREGRAPRIVTARDGAGAVEICEAEGESIRTGRIVELG